MNSGIYIITNLENGKVYIGSSVSIKTRWQNHKSSLRYERHRNPHLQAAWNLYGETAFEFGVLEYLDDPEKLHLAEQWWMDLYRGEGTKLYNFGLAAYCPALGRTHTVSEESRDRVRGENHYLWGRHPSEETRRRQSKAHLGVPLSKEHRRRISEGGKGGKGSLGYRHTKDAKQRIASAFAKPYPAYINEYTGEVIPAGINLKALCRECGLNPSHMGAIKNGKRLSHKGWRLLCL